MYTDHEWCFERKKKTGLSLEDYTKQTVSVDLFKGHSIFLPSKEVDNVFSVCLRVHVSSHVCMCVHSCMHTSVCMIAHAWLLACVQTKMLLRFLEKSQKV